MPSDRTPGATGDSGTSRAATGEAPAPAIDGRVPSEVVAPDDGRAVADLLADATARGRAVAPFGGGMALQLGNPPERLDLALSTARLGGILDYEPTDLVLSVGAGARFGDVQAVLAEQGQRLTIEAPEEATIGGLIATALAGPRRLGSGTLRDLLIGISVAHPSGTITKAGGMVVKNVTGFDLTRVYHGSLGTLGVILSANFKVLPLPRHEATVVARCDEVAAALAAAERVRESAIAPVALEVSRAEGGWLVALLLEGREATVHALATVATARLETGGDAEAETLAGADSADWWRRYRQAQTPTTTGSEALVRCAVRPRATAACVTALLDLEARDVVALNTLQASPGLGLIHVRIAPREGGSAAWLATAQRALLGIADNVTILAAPPAWKEGLDVWGRTPETIELMRDLKAQFDPRRVLNPGRLVGFL